MNNIGKNIVNFFELEISFSISFNRMIIYVNFFFTYCLKNNVDSMWIEYEFYVIIFHISSI